MKSIHPQEEQERLYKENLKKRIAAAFPYAGKVEDNLNIKPEDRVYRFNAECYRDTGQSILIWHDIWLPKSRIKIVWGELQDDFIINVKLSVPKWLVKVTMLNKYLKAD
jgi:hypothetical protein